MAFYENYVKLCNLAGKSPSAVAVELKLGKPSVTRWKHGAVPRDTTILKIAGYFGVSVEELTQDTKKRPPQQRRVSAVGRLPRVSVRLFVSCIRRHRRAVCSTLRACLHCKTQRKVEIFRLELGQHVHYPFRQVSLFRHK